MWLLIDDAKDLSCDVIARNAEAARTLLGGVGYAFEGLCLDYDLGGNETGYDILKWAIDSGTLPKKVQLVTMNPVGRERMAVTLTEAGYKPNTHGIYVHG